MNDDFDVTVLHSLRVTDLPPSAVDLARAARTGRRRLRLRYTAVAGVVAALILLSTVAAAVVVPRLGGTPAVPLPVPSSTVAPPLGGCVMGPETKPWMSHVPWMVNDDSWRVAVYLDNVDAVRWIDGKSELIRRVPSGFMVADASRSGDFAGVDNRNKQAWVYHGGRFNRLTLPVDGVVTVRDMNDRGDVVGVVGATVVVWPAGHPGRPRVLTAPDAGGSAAVGIAADGTVVGNVSGGTPFLWHPDGTGEPLPTPAGVAGGAVGALVGDWATGPGVRWNIRTGRADVVTGVAGTGTPDLYGRVYGQSTGPGAPPVAWVNGRIEAIPEPSGEHAFVLFVRSDGRALSGSRSNGVLEWTCGG